MKATIASWFKHYRLIILLWDVQAKYGYATLHIYASDHMTGNKHEFYF